MQRLGLIGYGGFGAFLTTAWRSSNQVALQAVADPQAAGVPPGVTWYPQAANLLADPSVDLVVVATPPHTHADLAIQALRAGKHVLVEKPVATSTQDAHRVLAVASAARGRISVDFMLRYHPLLEAMIAWGRSQVMGCLRHVLVENYAQDETLPPQHWFWDREQSGGILIEHAVHFIDVVHAAAAAPVRSVSGVAAARSATQIDRMGLTVLYENGVVASQMHMFNRPGFFEQTTFRFIFDLAEVTLDGWIPLRGTVRALVDPEREAVLRQLPGFTCHKRRPIQEIHDASRPEGWGGNAPQRTQDRVQVGGIAYAAKEEVSGHFGLEMTKSDAYQAALRCLMHDFVAALGDPSHRPRVRFEDGVQSLAIAEAATRQVLVSLSK